MIAHCDKRIDRERTPDHEEIDAVGGPALFEELFRLRVDER